MPREACICTPVATQFYDVLTNTCQPKKTEGSTCQSRAECAYTTNPSAVQCAGTAPTRCLCTPNVGWLNGVNCDRKGVLGDICPNSNACQDYAMQVCTGTCNCNSDMFFNATSNLCQWLGHDDDFCTANAQCISNSCPPGTNYCQ